MDAKRKPFLNIVFEEHSSGFERLVMLCDGIFAIAMTLLVLDIKLPDGAIGSGEKFSLALNDLLTKSAFYLLTFIVVAACWRGHRRLMTYIRRQDESFTLLTLVFLAFVVFFPVSFNVVVESGKYNQSIIFYTLVMAGCGFSVFLLWVYASWNHRLIDPEISSQEILARSVGLLINPVYFCLSLLLLLVPGIANDTVFWSWVFLPVFAIIVRRMYEWIEKRLDLSPAEAAEEQAGLEG